MHACVDATQDLLSKNGGLELDAITSIEVDSYLRAVTPDFRVNPDPATYGQGASACR